VDGGTPGAGTAANTGEAGVAKDAVGDASASSCRLHATSSGATHAIARQRTAAGMVIRMAPPASLRDVAPVPRLPGSPALRTGRHGLRHRAHVGRAAIADAVGEEPAGGFR